MKILINLTVFFSILTNSIQGQQIPFNYSLRTKPININGFNGLHSFAVANWNNKWLLIGGRLDGLHARQPFNAFPETGNNNNIYVIDVNTQQVWATSLTSLNSPLQEQLQASNTNFYQDDDTLYIMGGYGYSSTLADHITFPNLTSVLVSELVNAVITSQPITPFFKQITDPVFTVSGGQLGKIAGVYYLVGGHKFDGRYNPMGNPTYTQTYVDGMRKFKLNNSGTQLTYTNYTTVSDAVDLHRRDYNLVPQIFPNNEEGYLISSGVFQVGVDLPFLYPVEIRADSYNPVTSFYQYLSNYHSAKTSLYDSVNKVMHSVFFGGMSQFYYDNNVLMQDNNVPFVKTISRLSRDSSGNYQEFAFSNEMPVYIGSSSEFVLNHGIPHYNSEIIKLSQLSADSVLIGHIIGGIYSTETNPFTNNNTEVTNAYNTIYEVWLVKDINASVRALNGNNRLELRLYPNPTVAKLYIEANFPYNSELNLYITNLKGEVISEIEFGIQKQGQQIVNLSDKVKLSKGTYFFNFVFDGRFSKIEKVVVN